MMHILQFFVFFVFLLFAPFAFASSVRDDLYQQCFEKYEAEEYCQCFGGAGYDYYQETALQRKQHFFDIRKNAVTNSTLKAKQDGNVTDDVIERACQIMVPAQIAYKAFKPSPVQRGKHKRNEYSDSQKARMEKIWADMTSSVNAFYEQAGVPQAHQRYIKDVCGARVDMKILEAEFDDLKNRAASDTLLVDSFTAFAERFGARRCGRYRK